MTNSQTQLNAYEQQRGIATANYGTYNAEVQRIVNEATSNTAFSAQECMQSSDCDGARSIIAQLNAGDDLSQVLLKLHFKIVFNSAVAIISRVCGS